MLIPDQIGQSPGALLCPAAHLIFIVVVLSEQYLRTIQFDTPLI